MHVSQIPPLILHNSDIEPGFLYEKPISINRNVLLC